MVKAVLSGRADEVVDLATTNLWRSGACSRLTKKERTMRIVHFEKGGVPGIAADDGSGWHGLTKRESGFPGTLPELIAQGADLLHRGKALLPMPAIDLNAVRILPPVP